MSMNGVTLENLTPEQWDILKEIDLYTRNELKFEPRELCYWFLLKFCIAREFNIPLIKLMLTDYVKFTESLSERKVNEISPKDETFAEIRENVSFGFHYCDKLGRPVLIYRVGHSNFKHLFKKYSVDQIVDYHIQLSKRYENLLAPIASKIENKRIDKLVVIIDMKNADILSFLSGKNNEFIKRLIHHGQQHFPNILGKQYIINVSSFFSIFWSVIKHFLHPATQEKIEITSGSNKERLIAEIGADSLYKDFGGNSDEDFRENPGPWKNELEESYKNKTFYLKQESVFQDYFWTKEERKCQEKTRILVNKSSMSFQDLEEINSEISIREIKTIKMTVSMQRIKF